MTVYVEAGPKEVGVKIDGQSLTLTLQNMTLDIQAWAFSYQMSFLDVAGTAEFGNIFVDVTSTFSLGDGFVVTAVSQEVKVDPNYMILKFRSDVDARLATTVLSVMETDNTGNILKTDIEEAISGQNSYLTKLSKLLQCNSYQDSSSVMVPADLNKQGIEFTIPAFPGTTLDGKAGGDTITIPVGKITELFENQLPFAVGSESISNIHDITYEE